MHDNWFKMLADGVLSIGDINKQLVESFKTAMQDFFPCRLKAFLGELSNPTKILGEDTIKNIYSLKLLQSILADKDINNFTIIKHMLNITSPTGGVDLAVDLLKTNIAVLKELVIERDPNYVLNILTERWQKFVDLKPIKDINKEIYDIIYKKLIIEEMPYQMDNKIYYNFLKVIALKDVESIPLSDLDTKDCCPELVESYCKMGNVSFDGAEIFESYNPSEVMGNTVGFDPAFTG
ncbi:hypothetical protein [Rickettsia endosymbiont of Polydrusus tereticollis]|uniref:hypothetical protein n=1 Tax=Rickettsia endosymbiont of Polydrusus tereticollis TaxID=3066251 RepID=UPI003133313E